MFHTPVFSDKLAEESGCAIRHELGQLAAGLDICFLQVGTSLASAVETIDRVIAGLDGVTHALGRETAGAAVESLRDVARRLTELPARQARLAEQMVAVTEISRELGNHIVGIHHILRVLGIYGVNIKIAASGEEQFVGFVDGMSARLEMGGRELDGFLIKLKELTVGITSVQQAERLLAGECSKVVPMVPEKLICDSRKLDDYLGSVAAMAGRVASIARSVQGKVAVILSALQVGDSTRQRLEHIVSALHMVEARGGRSHPTAQAHIEQLLTAQLEATAADFTHETTALLSSLEELGPDVASLLALIDDQSEGEGRAFLTELEQGITKIEQVTTQLRHAEGRSLVMAEVIGDTVAVMTERLDHVQRIQTDVKDIATNTRLLCRRHGSIGKSVSVIATEIDLYTLRLGEAATGVGQAVAALGATAMSSCSKADDKKSDIGATLAVALRVIREGCQRTETAALQGNDDALQLMRLIMEASETLSQHAGKDIIKASAKALSLRSSQRPLLAPDEEVARTLLRDIAMLYTMAQERDIHSRFLLPGMELTPPQVEADEEDDGLF